MSERAAYCERAGSLADLLSLSRERLEHQDIAWMSFLAAQGLPGAEDLHIPAYMARLDRWAQCIRRETARGRHLYEKRPEDFDNSEAIYRMRTLVTVMKRDLKCHYNFDRSPKSEDRSSV